MDSSCFPEKVIQDIDENTKPKGGRRLKKTKRRKILH
jgi:hypothetical protein